MIDDIADTMGSYYEAWFNVLTIQAFLIDIVEPQLREQWKIVSENWKKFTELSSIKSNATSKLHILGSKSALDILSKQQKLYEEHWQLLQNNTVMTHEENKELGTNISAHRNDFYRSLRKVRKQLENNT